MGSHGVTQRSHVHVGLTWGSHGHGAHMVAGHIGSRPASRQLTRARRRRRRAGFSSAPRAACSGRATSNS
eukprot:2567287-Prymnesium_polylepis.1